MWSVRSGVSVDSHGWVPVPVPDPVSDYRAMTHSSSVAGIAAAAAAAVVVVAVVAVVVVAVVAAVVGRYVWVTDLFLPYDYMHCQIQVQEQKKRKKKKRRRKKERGGLGGTLLDPGVRQP
jgi:type IV secretory pathway VirB3-like protein